MTSLSALRATSTYPISYSLFFQMFASVSTNKTHKNKRILKDRMPDQERKEGRKEGKRTSTVKISKPFNYSFFHFPRALVFRFPELPTPPKRTPDLSKRRLDRVDCQGLNLISGITPMSRRRLGVDFEDSRPWPEGFFVWNTR